MPSEFKSLLGRQFVIDSHVVDDASPEVVALRQYHRDGWINLTKTDVPDTEFLGAPPQKRDRLLQLSGEYVEHLGPLVLGHSRLDHAVAGSWKDEAHLRDVFDLLFPGRTWEAARRQDIRDAMNVATSIRYGADGFITNDKALLKAGERIRIAFNGFTISPPTQALAFVERLLVRHKARAEKI